MNIPNQPEISGFTPSEYEICIKGRLGPETTAWFEDMTLTVDEETSPSQTIIRGTLVDQAALYGLISRARDLGLTLVSVKRIDEAEDIEPQALKGEVADPIENNQSNEDTQSN